MYGTVQLLNDLNTGRVIARMLLVLRHPGGEAGLASVIEDEAETRIGSRGGASDVRKAGTGQLHHKSCLLLCDIAEQQ